MDADVVVIGSGIAGAFTAWSLAQRGLRVLVLEAGPRITRTEAVAGFTSTHHYDLTAGYPNPPWAEHPRWVEQQDQYIQQIGPEFARFEYLRVVGGTTWHWTAGTGRLFPADMRMRSTHGVGVDWPITYSDIESKYLDAEREMGVSGDEGHAFGPPRSGALPLPPMPVGYMESVIQERLKDLDIRVIRNSVARNSIPFDGRPRCEGYGTCTPICPIGAQYAAIVHVEKAERLGARVMAGMRVDRLETDGDRRITSARCKQPDGSEALVSGKVFVLAANGVESPRLLLASATDSNPRGLANSSDQVGRNFSSHPAVHVEFETPYPLYPGRGPRARGSISKYCVGPFRAHESGFGIGIENAAPLQPLAARLLLENKIPPELDRELRDLVVRRAGFLYHVEQLPNPENRISIDWNVRDRAGQPRITCYYSLGEYERRGLATAKTTIDKFLKRLDARPIRRSSNLSLNHLMGTLRMGNDPKSSVCDAFGRAHDHPNLYVAGSALFPSSGLVGPTLTIAALALRTADAIAKEFG